MSARKKNVCVCVCVCAFLVVRLAARLSAPEAPLDQRARGYQEEARDLRTGEQFEAWASPTSPWRRPSVPGEPSGPSPIAPSCLRGVGVNASGRMVGVGFSARGPPCLGAPIFPAAQKPTLTRRAPMRLPRQAAYPAGAQEVNPKFSMVDFLRLSERLPCRVSSSAVMKEGRLGKSRAALLCGRKRWPSCCAECPPFILLGLRVLLVFFV
jgi:hypothetical protein